MVRPPGAGGVRLAVVILLAGSLTGAGLAAGAEVVGASHGASDADYTVEPVDDRRPGATDVTYGQIVVGTADVSYRTFERMTAIYEEGSWEGCGPSQSEVFGIDRGNTYDDYGTDDDLETHTKTFSADEDVFQAEFYGEDDFGSTIGLQDGDAVVSVASCIDNPDEPGWYQITGSTTGVTESGERKTVEGESHYFWICECADETEARETLGPPPSEPAITPTPAGSASGGEARTTENGTGGGHDGDAGIAGSSGERSSDDGAADGSGDGGVEDGATPSGVSTPKTSEIGAGRSADGSTAPRESESDGNPGSAGGSRTGASADTPSSWDDHRVRTPTPGDGEGFDGPVALAAFLAVAVLVRRRR
jgi:hypothetical protein